MRLADIRELVPVANREDFNRANFWHEGDYGEAVLSVQARKRWSGQPHSYWIDTLYLPTTTGTVSTPAPGGNYIEPARPVAPALRLRVAPIPDRAFVLKWDSEINPPSITEANLAEASMVFELPGGNGELILEAFVFQRWSACPWFKNESAKAEIGRQYKIARAALTESEPHVSKHLQMIAVV